MIAVIVAVVTGGEGTDNRRDRSLSSPTAAAVATRHVSKQPASLSPFYVEEGGMKKKGWSEEDTMPAQKPGRSLRGEEVDEASSSAGEEEEGTKITSPDDGFDADAACRDFGVNSPDAKSAPHEEESEDEEV